MNIRPSSGTYSLISLSARGAWVGRQNSRAVSDSERFERTAPVDQDPAHLSRHNP
jgi:hypothetical protein